MPAGTRPLQADASYEKEFSICCLVTSWKQYSEVLNSLEKMGFPLEYCECLVCDNTERNVFSAFDAVRAFMKNARGKYVLILHQDAFPAEHYDVLAARIRELEAADPMWGVIGNAGRKAESPFQLIGSLITPTKHFRLGQPFVAVETIDENVMIIKNGTGITASADLSGYHFYAFDVCSIAARLGFNSYVVDYKWEHGSVGKIDERFFQARKQVEAKMAMYHPECKVTTTCATLYWGKSRWGALLSECRGLHLLEDSKLHCNGSALMSKEAALKWPLFHIVRSFYPDSVFRRGWHVIYWHARYAIKKFRWEAKWWRKNWRTRLKC